MGTRSLANRKTRPLDDLTPETPDLDAPAPPIKRRASRKPRGRPTRGGKKRAQGTRAREAAGRTLLGAFELFVLTTAGLVGVVLALGFVVEWLDRERPAQEVLAFAGFVLMVIVASGVLSRAWWSARGQLSRVAVILPAIGATAIGFGAYRMATSLEFDIATARLQILLGGRAAAERRTLEHQVYAAYRRTDLGNLEILLQRGQPYDTYIREAAAAFGVDAELLAGVAATESSFMPRHSKDGGRGLFQITTVPESAMHAAMLHTHGAPLDLSQPRDNAMVAASTLRIYLDQMKGDLFLGLLAYNIGPANGGLRSIMTQYGARDFVTIQPYLQNLPREYPIRVLSFALAYRIRHIEGRLLPYNEGSNATRIQQFRIPGLNR